MSDYDPTRGDLERIADEFIDAELDRWDATFDAGVGIPAIIAWTAECPVPRGVFERAMVARGFRVVSDGGKQKWQRT